MKLLLDTCTFLWICAEPEEISHKAKNLFEDAENEVYLSSISAWEVALKYAAGKLPLPRSPEKMFPEMREKHRITELPLSERSVLAVLRMPKLHRDPFDRMLAAQAFTEGMVILTPDPLISQYPVQVEW